MIVVHAAAERELEVVGQRKPRPELSRDQAQIVGELVAVAVYVVLQRECAGGAEEFHAFQLVAVQAGEAFRIHVVVPDQLLFADPRLRHLAADDLQPGDGRRVIIHVRAIEPQIFLDEIVVEVLVGRAGVVAVARGDANAGLDLRGDLRNETDARANALAVLGAFRIAVLNADALLPHAHVTRHDRVGRPRDFLLKIVEVLFRRRFACGRCRLLLLRQVGGQFLILGLRDRAVRSEHAEQLCIDGVGRCGRGHGGDDECAADVQSGLPHECLPDGFFVCPHIRGAAVSLRRMTGA